MHRPDNVRNATMAVFMRQTDGDGSSITHEEPPISRSSFHTSRRSLDFSKFDQDKNVERVNIERVQDQTDQRTGELGVSGGVQDFI
ncbi:hypothetical protein PCASD_04974 [Puccinia coronata f. sp. avenae]|uniref:Uncharacterized protein n=1 Tax=Puccinia coronata f. sp. avenae TaxID=200324 RepID=A0A2N5VD83_9BASI|nr:hypothetical protein PCASD_04974 [Puccinia coronata f. sp. avenae]